MSLIGETDGEAGRNRLIGMLCIAAGIAAFSAMDVAIKFLSGDYALHQVVLIRTVIGMSILLGVIVPFHGGYAALRTNRLPLHLLRGFFVIIANTAFFVALASMPLAEAVAITFVSPLLITAFSVVILGESVGPRRWVAVVVGLIGVLIVLQPGTAAFQPAALLPLFAAVAYAMLNILSRKMGGTERATTLTFYVQLTFLVFSGAMGLAFGDGRFDGTGDASIDFLMRGWVWPAAKDWPVFVLVGFSSGFGAVLLSQAYRLCEPAMIAPFEYIAMPLAVLGGVVVFGEWPDALSWLGIALIVLGGLYMLWRETRARDLPRAPRVRR